MTKIGAKGQQLRALREAREASNVVELRPTSTAVTVKRATLGNMPQTYSAARNALAQCVRVDEVKKEYDKAKAVEMYAKQAKDRELLAFSAQIRMCAERRLGQVMEDERIAGKLAKGTRGSPVKGARVASGPTLAERGVDKHLADRARKAAAMSEGKFVATVEKRQKLAVAAVEGDASFIAEAKAERMAEKASKRAAREKEMAARIITLPTKKYGVIYADPEWKFINGPERAAENHYTTSELEAIKARDVPSICADDCVLFLWTTAPMLDQQIEVLKAWGFRYVTEVVWRKDKIGTGYWFRNKHESLLVGVRGSVPAPAMGTQWESVFDAPRGKHSAKPDKAYELIEAYFPNVPKVELNARKRRKGWDSWGAEVPKEAVG